MAASSANYRGPNHRYDEKPEAQGWGPYHYNQWSQAERNETDAMVDENWRKYAEGILEKDPGNAQALHMLERVEVCTKEREGRQ